MRVWLVVAVALVLVVVTTGSAWCAAESGQVEVAGTGSFIMSVIGGVSPAYDVSASAHKLLTNHVSGGARVAVAGIGGSYRAINAWLTADLYTMISPTAMPYLGAGIGESWTRYGSYGSSNSYGIVEGHLGIKNFVSEGTAVSLEARYETYMESLDSGSLVLHVGLSVFF